VTSQLGSIEAMIADGPSNPMYYWALVAVKDSRAAYNNWQKANDFLQPLVDATDILFPSLYMANDAPEAFEPFAEESIRECKRFRKLCYPYLWPRFHQSNPVLAGQFIPGEDMRAQYEAVRRYGANGMVVWDHNNIAWSNFPWFQELTQFINSIP